MPKCLFLSRPRDERLIDWNGKLGLHGRFRSHVVRIGKEGAPVLVIDDFLGNPQLLIDHAASQASFVPGDAAYPGLRAAIPEIYSFALRTFLGELICKPFDLGDSAVVGGACGYALVTTPPGRLQLVQRMPHFDSTNPRQIAILHYLCPAEHGGTSFYRHRRTGYEMINRQRIAGYTASVKEELRMQGPPPARYIDGDDSMFERTAEFEAAFNRVLVYRSVNLHSAAIRPDFRFDADPRSGRLTVNTLFVYR